MSPLLVRTTLFAVVTLAALGCGEPTEPVEIDEETDEESSTPRDYDGPIGGDREVEPIFPEDYDVDGDHPLLLLLHGFGSNANETLAGFNIEEEASNRGVVILAPEGKTDSRDDQFWNATEYCCDLDETGVDDVGYLTGLIDEAVEQYAVDPDQVFAMGISNGAMMSHRMACDRGDLLRGIASFNGTSMLEADNCNPEDPTHIVHIHGTDDEVVPYDGNAVFPSAEEVVDRWVDFNDCDPDPVDGSSVNVTAAVDGDETTIDYYDNCVDGGDVEFWTMHGARHVPLPLADFEHLIFDTLLD